MSNMRLKVFSTGGFSLSEFSKLEVYIGTEAPVVAPVVAPVPANVSDYMYSVPANTDLITLSVGVPSPEFMPQPSKRSAVRGVNYFPQPPDLAGKKVFYRLVDEMGNSSSWQQDGVIPSPPPAENLYWSNAALTATTGGSAVGLQGETLKAYQNLSATVEYKAQAASPAPAGGYPANTAIVFSGAAITANYSIFYVLANDSGNESNFANGGMVPAPPDPQMDGKLSELATAYDTTSGIYKIKHTGSIEYTISSTYTSVYINQIKSGTISASIAPGGYSSTPITPRSDGGALQFTYLNTTTNNESALSPVISIVPKAPVLTAAGLKNSTGQIIGTNSPAITDITSPTTIRMFHSNLNNGTNLTAYVQTESTDHTASPPFSFAYNADGTPLSVWAPVTEGRYLAYSVINSALPKNESAAAFDGTVPPGPDSAALNGLAYSQVTNDVKALSNFANFGSGTADLKLLLFQKNGSTYDIRGTSSVNGPTGFSPGTLISSITPLTQASTIAYCYSDSSGNESVYAEDGIIESCEDVVGMSLIGIWYDSGSSKYKTYFIETVTKGASYAGAKLKLYNNNTYIGEQVADSNGSFAGGYSGIVFPDGAYNESVVPFYTITTPQGNESLKVQDGVVAGLSSVSYSADVLTLNFTGNVNVLSNTSAGDFPLYGGPVYGAGQSFPPAAPGSSILTINAGASNNINPGNPDHKIGITISNNIVSNIGENVIAPVAAGGVDIQ